jgi:hypothetical protein
MRIWILATCTAPCQAPPQVGRQAHLEAVADLLQELGGDAGGGGGRLARTRLGRLHGAHQPLDARLQRRLRAPHSVSRAGCTAAGRALVSAVASSASTRLAAANSPRAM